MSEAANKSLNFFWFLPTSGDGPYLGTDDYHRAPDFPYLRDVAIAADRLGFKGVLIPTGANCEDSWITAASVAPFTEQLKFLVAIRPGIASPAFYARQTAALDRISNGRALLNIVVGGNPGELAGDGVFLSHDERYDHAREFFDVFETLVRGEATNFEGKYLSSKGAKLQFLPKSDVPLYFGGSSDAAIDFAGDRVEKYLTWGEPLDQVAEKVERVRAAAARRGRTVSFGIRLHFIVRETDDEAWAAADKLISRLDDKTIIEAQHRFATQSDSEGQRRMAALHGGDRSKLVVAPNLWAGVGLVRGGAGTALVGSPETVAERLREYQSVGIDTVIGSGYPHLEEAYRVGELLFPKLGLGAASEVIDTDLGGVEFAKRPRRITGLAAAV